MLLLESILSGNDRDRESVFARLKALLGAASEPKPTKCTKKLYSAIVALIDEELSSSCISNVRTALETLRYIAKGNSSCKQGFNRFLEYGISEKLVEWLERVLSLPDTLSGKDSAVEDSIFTIIVILEHCSVQEKQPMLGLFPVLLGWVCSRSNLYHSRIEAAEALNHLLETCSSEQKTSLCSHDDVLGNINKLGHLLFTAGDYQLQEALLECIFQVTSPPVRQSLATKWFPHATLLHLLASFKMEQFDIVMDSRKFLNTLNEAAGSNRNVYSLPCSAAKLGTSELTGTLDQLWVDFNISSSTISMSVAVEGTADCTVIVLKRTVVQRWNLSLNKDGFLLSLATATPPCPLLSKSTEPVTLLFPKLHDPTIAVNKVLGPSIAKPPAPSPCTKSSIAITPLLIRTSSVIDRPTAAPSIRDCQSTLDPTTAQTKPAHVTTSLTSTAAQTKPAHVTTPLTSTAAQTKPAHVTTPLTSTAAQTRPAPHVTTPLTPHVTTPLTSTPAQSGRLPLNFIATGEVVGAKKQPKRRLFSLTNCPKATLTNCPKATLTNCPKATLIAKPATSCTNQTVPEKDKREAIKDVTNVQGQPMRRQFKAISKSKKPTRASVREVLNDFDLLCSPDVHTGQEKLHCSKKQTSCRSTPIQHKLIEKPAAISHDKFKSNFAFEDEQETFSDVFVPPKPAALQSKKPKPSKLTSAEPAKKRLSDPAKTSPLELTTERPSASAKTISSAPKTRPLEVPKTRQESAKTTPLNLAKETGNLSGPKKTRPSDPAKARLSDTVKTTPLDPLKRTEKPSEAKKTRPLATILSSEPAKAGLSESANTSLPEEISLGSAATAKPPQMAKKSILEATKARPSEAAKISAVQQNAIVGNSVLKAFSSALSDNTQQKQSISSINCHDDAGVEDSPIAVPNSFPVDLNLPSQDEEYDEIMDTDHKSKSNSKEYTAGLQIGVPRSLPCEQDEFDISPDGFNGSNSKPDQFGGSIVPATSPYSTSEKDQCTQLFQAQWGQQDVLLTSPVSLPCEAQDESINSEEPHADHSVTLEFTKICKSLVSEATRRTKPSTIKASSAVKLQLDCAELSKPTATVEQKGKLLQRKRPLSSTINIPLVKKRALSRRNTSLPLSPPGSVAVVPCSSTEVDEVLSSTHTGSSPQSTADTASSCGTKLGKKTKLVQFASVATKTTFNQVKTVWDTQLTQRQTFLMKFEGQLTQELKQMEQAVTDRQSREDRMTLLFKKYVEDIGSVQQSEEHQLHQLRVLYEGLHDQLGAMANTEQNQQVKAQATLKGEMKRLQNELLQKMHHDDILHIKTLLQSLFV